MKNVVRLMTVAVAMATSLGLALPTASAQSSDESTFCEAVVDISLLFNAVDEEPTPKQEKQIGALLEKIEGGAPSELAEQASAAAEGVRTQAFEDPAFSEAVNSIDQWVADNCGYSVVPVTARDYEFEGVPETVEPGIVMFELTNEGAELHEMVIARIKGKESVEELLELPEKKADKKIVFAGATFASQGETTYAYADIKKPGRYGVVCFLPVGSVDEASAESADGPPHAAEGMFAEFEVNKGS